tara:strand:- start:7931 stop:8236 length:306 start_codon:yes stop_codon:yes gene_type:complete
MIAIIEGKKYNTETAEELASWHNRKIKCFKCDEKIYRTTKGAYFIWGEGGSATPWSKKIGSDSVAGSKIIVLTEAEVLDRLEKWQDINAIDTHFSHMIEEA